jgi:hypothetical protein
MKKNPPILPCSHCKRMVPRLEVDENTWQVVLRANKSKLLAAAEVKFWTQCEERHAKAWVDHLDCHFAWPLSEADQAVLRTIETAFADYAKPEHFTDFSHCEECQEHDDTLRAKTRDTLQRSDLGNAGWDPISFITEEGMAYFLPTMARLALLPDALPNHDWYGSRLLWHLWYDSGEGNRFLNSFSPKQRHAVHGLLEYLMATRSADFAIDDEEYMLLEALLAWA